jgi:O-antigen ligase
MHRSSRSLVSASAVRHWTPKQASGRCDQAGRSTTDIVLATTIENSEASPVGRVGFAIFAGYLVLAFTTAIPDQFALPKLLGLFLYAAFCAALWVLALRHGRVHGLPRPLALTTAALACWGIATTLTAQHVPTALFGMRGRYNGLASMLAGLALFLLIATARTSEREIERRLGAICVALTVASGYALVQAAGLDPIPWPQGRPASTLGHPVIFAGALAMALPFSIALALDGRSRVARLAWGGMSLVQGLALVLTLARGPWIGAVCGLVAFAALAIPHERALERRFLGLTVCAVLLVSAVLGASTATRERVLDRFSEVKRGAGDSSLSYRIHFYRAALAMLRDHPLVGVGWENYGLLYPRYRSSPTESIAPDLVPTMVHSGSLQVAVSGGIPAASLHFLFFSAVGMVVVRRFRGETDRRQKLLGAAFVGSAIAYLVQDLSGWPHVALGGLLFAVLGLGVCWGVRPQKARAMVRSRRALVAAASVIGIGAAWLSLDAWQRIRAERLMFEAEQLDVRKSWNSVEGKLRAALHVSPDRAWASDAAARVYLRRAAAAGDRRAYERGVELTNAARAANSFDPYVHLRRTELDIVAVDRGLLARVTDEGRDALSEARSMSVGSDRVRKVEDSLSRKAGNSRIVWIQPQATAGFGPSGSLVVAGFAPEALAGTHVFLHWRNATRKSAWITGANAPVPDGAGSWYNTIPNARLGERYEVYATCETWAYGPCTYTGNGSLNLCSPVSWIGPATTAGVGPPGSLVVGGSVPASWEGTDALLHWRNATRESAWTVQTIQPLSTAPGNWYSVIPTARTSERYEVYLSSAAATSEPCAYTGDGPFNLCSPIAWIQPRSTAGLGPPGSLVVAGSSREAGAGTPVFLHWRNVTRKTEWTTEAFAPAPDARGIWFNAIPDADPAERYQVYVTSPTTASATCTYAGGGSRSTCR